MSEKILIVILGPTCVGKTSLSIEIAKKFNTSILSCDSRQFYKELKIGTAAPDANQLSAVPHFLIGHISIEDYYNAYKFEQDALKILSGIYSETNVVVVTGGSGMYIDALCNGIDLIPDIDVEIRESLNKKFAENGIEAIRKELNLFDPEYYSIVDLKNPQRIIRALEVFYQTGKPFSSFRTNIKNNRDFTIIKIGLERERSDLYNRINLRVIQMVEQGLVDEAAQFYKFRHLNSLNTVGYKEVFDFFDEKISMSECIELIQRNTRRYAKKQISWFHRDSSTVWFNADDFQTISDYISSCIQKKINESTI